MTDEEKKARAAQLGISVDELDKGIADGTLTFDDESQPELPAPAAQEPETPEQPPVSAPSYEEAKSGIVGKASGSRGNMAKNFLDSAEGQAAVHERIGEEQAASINAEADAIRKASTAFETKANNITQRTIDANNTYRAAVDTANKAQMQSNRDILQRYISDAELARKENEVMGKAERSATLWTGATELASALANLIGVSRGAENQQIKLYSEDWMKRAEQNRKDRIRRLDSLNDRRSALEQQIAALQASGDKELAQVDLNNEKYKNDREDQSAQRLFNVGVTLAGKKKEAESAVSKGKATGDLTKWGGVEKASTAAFMPRGGGRTTTTTTTDGTKDYDKMRKSGYYPLMIDGEQYWMDDKTLFRNIQALKRSINVLNVEDQKELDNIANKSQDDQAKFLLSAMESNPGLKDALKKLSPGKVDDGEPVEKKDAAEAYE